MASVYTPTGTYSNLTRLQLEQLRKADFFAGGKGLTVGDSALPPEGVVGPGDINAEPYLTGASTLLDDVYGLTPPAQPGESLLSITQTSDLPSETAKWYGPTRITDGLSTGSITTGGTSPVLTDTVVDFVAAGVLAGDTVLIKSGTGANQNQYAVATVANPVANHTLTLGAVNNSFAEPGTPTQLNVDGDTYTYIIVRPNAVQLFAVPGSGATGFEQSFMAVIPGSSLHNNVAPSLTQINTDRLRNLVPPQYSLDNTVDRADGVFPTPAPRTSLDKLGYRIVLYPDNGANAPNLAAPLATLNPVIDPTIPASDQRLTVDYKAGIVRFSCEPKIGGQIKVAGGTNPTTGRLNLYAVYWIVDQTLVKGVARGLWTTRSTPDVAFPPAKIYWDSTNIAWRIGSTETTNTAYIRAVGAQDDPTKITEFGAIEPGFSLTPRRYLGYHPRPAGGLTGQWVLVKQDPALGGDPPAEQFIQDKTMVTVGDTSGPALAVADYNPTDYVTNPGARATGDTLAAALAAAPTGIFGTVHLRRGRYYVRTTEAPIHIPPGIVVEGEDLSTIIQARVFTDTSVISSLPVFKFGANTPWGVYDGTYNQFSQVVTPTKFNFANASERIEGYDIVWNPVRRVWAIVYADATTQALIFNEVNPAGVKTFPAQGVDLKNTPTNFFTNASPNSNNHTTGHYPRIAYSDAVEQYTVVWSEELVAGGVTGPTVKSQTFQVNLTTSPVSILPNGGAVQHQVDPVVTPFSAHPSVAFDTDPGGGVIPTIGVTYWAYALTGSPLQPSSCYEWRHLFNSPSFVNTILNTGTFLSGPQVVSSTDICADGNGGFLYTYSRRQHPALFGSAGTITLTNTVGGYSYFTDPAVSNWGNRGVVPGSKFMYLGVNRTSIPAGATLQYLQPTVGYGTDGTVYDTTSSVNQARIKISQNGYVFNPMTQWQELTSIHGQIGTPDNQHLTDTTVNFLTLGVQSGDVIYEFVDGFPHIHRITGVTATVLSIAPSTFEGTAAGQTYFVFYSQPFNWAMVPQSYVDTIRYVSSGGFTSETIAMTSVVGAAPSPTAYTIAEIEPDFVRLARGSGDNWLLVYQTFNTTSIFSKPYVNNFDDRLNTAFLDQLTPLALQDYQAAYREHISTCAVLLNDAGAPVYPSPQTTTTSLTTAPNFVPRSSRDVEVSNRSLGARTPITKRPNFVRGFNSNGLVPSPNVFGAVYNYALQVSPLCFTHRWSSTIAPSLLPDVDWSGLDWTVVSPSKRSIHGYTGNYIVIGTGSGQTYFGDPMFYFGTGAGNAVDGNYQQSTVAIGDLIYFPFNGTSGTILAIHSEHIVQLSETDSALLNKGVAATTTVTGASIGANLNSFTGTQTLHVLSTTGFPSFGYLYLPTHNAYMQYQGTAVGQFLNCLTIYGTGTLGAEAVNAPSYSQNSEWVLVRSANSVRFSGGGVKNPAFRVSADGRPVFSTSYITFADDPTEDTFATTPDEVLLMRRSNADVMFGQFNGNADGSNLPGNIFEDRAEPNLRYTANINFRGAALGEPKGCNELSLGQAPSVAIAWGETMVGFLDHVNAGGTSQRTNYVGFYRQSLGPYFNGLRNMTIVNSTQTAFTGASLSWSQLKVLSRQRVLTRHGMPNASGGYFATDGFRNVFVSALQVHENVESVLSPGTFNNDRTRLVAVYTDSLGRGPITVHGPRPIYNLRGDESTSNFYWSTSPQAPISATPVGMSHPRVLHDGSRFVAVWAEGGTGTGTIGSQPCVLNLAIFPGDEDTGPQGPELVNTYDGQGPRIIQSQPIEIRSGTWNGAGFNPFTSQFFVNHDMAFSGKVYAVVWTAGLDPSQAGNPCMLGVTMFDAQGLGGQVGTSTAIRDTAALAMPSLTGTTGFSTGSNLFQDSLATFNGTGGVKAGDILIIHGSVAQGRYTVRVNAVAATFIGVDQPVPVGTGYTYSIHRAEYPPGASTYILAVAGWAPVTNQEQVAFTTPKIVWNGSKFVVVFGNHQHGLVSAGTSQTNVLGTLDVPENGLQSALQVKRIAPLSSAFVDGIIPGLGSPTSVSLGMTTIDISQNGTDYQSRAQPLYNVGDIFAISSTVVTASSASITAVTNSDIATVTGLVGLTANMVGQRLLLAGTANPGNTGSFVIVAFISSTSVQISNPTAVAPDGNNGSIVWAIFSHLDDGWYPITEINWVTNTLLVSYAATVTQTVGNTVSIYGSVISAPVGDPLQRITGTVYGAGANQGLSPRPLLLAPGESTLATNNGFSYDRLHSFIYNDVDDEYALLYSNWAAYPFGTANLVFQRWKRGWDRPAPEVLVSTTLGIVCADMAFNGREYCVIWGESTSFNFEVLHYTLLSATGVVESTGIVDNGRNAGGVIGNTLPNQIPGQLAGAYVTPSSMIARLNNMQVRWNNRLNRWVISASYQWLSDSPLFPANELPPNYPLLSAAAGGINNNQITLATSASDLSYFQPGCKLLVNDAGATNSAKAIYGIVAVNTSGPVPVITLDTANILSIQNPPYISQTTVTGASIGQLLSSFTGTQTLHVLSNTGFQSVGTLYFPTHNAYMTYNGLGLNTFTNCTTIFGSGTLGAEQVNGGNGSLIVLPREDIVCYTLGSTTPAVQFVDSDESFLENVSIGGTLDIEEKYDRMATPMWQAASPTVGQPSLFDSVYANIFSNDFGLLTEALVIAPSIGVNINTFTGTQTLHVDSAAGFLGTIGVVYLPGHNAYISYQGTGATTLTNVTTLFGASGTLTSTDVVMTPPTIPNVQRPAQYNHLLMKPNRVRVPTFTNIRSSTKMRYGYGLSANNPQSLASKFYFRRG